MNAMFADESRSSQDLSSRQKQDQQLDSIVEIVTPENIAFNYQAAGPFRRLPAWIIDMVILIAMLFGLGILLTLLLSLFGLGGLGEFTTVGITLFVFLVAAFVSYWFYGVFFETYMNGRTPGKMMMGIRTLSVDGTPINGMQATLRNLLRVADLLPILPITVLEPWILLPPYIQFFFATIPTCIVGLVVMSLNRRYQRIGDLVAGTIVVVEERSWLMGVAKLEDPRTAQLASILPPKFRVNRDLAKALSAYVERRRYFSQARRREIARHLGEPLIRVFGLPPDTSHDLLLCALYYRTFVADKGDAQAPMILPQQGTRPSQAEAEGIFFDPAQSSNRGTADPPPLIKIQE